MGSERTNGRVKVFFCGGRGPQAVGRGARAGRPQAAGHGPRRDRAGVSEGMGACETPNSKSNGWVRSLEL